MNDTLLAFVRAGLPVLPVNEKTKEPLIYTHKFLDDALPDEAMYAQYEQCGVAIKMGNTQTKIECIDFDLKNDPLKDDPEKNVFARFKTLCDISGLYLESTPSGGYHILYRTYTVPGSHKLAYCKGKKEAVIETRGRGGYAVVSPSKGYKTIQGNIYAIPHIEQDRAEEILSICAALNECSDRIIKKTPETIYSRTYNKKHSGEVLDKLLADGWAVHRDFADKVWLSRPGKTRGVSGTVYKDSGVFYCFTTSAGYDGNCAYSPYAITMRSKNYTPEQMEREVCEEIGEKYIKDLISEHLTNELKLKDFELKKTLFDIVIADLLRRGKFYRTTKNGTRGFYLYENNLYLCHIDDRDFCCMMFILYGLTKTEGYCKKLYEDIKNYSLSSGEVVEIHNYSHIADSTVYIDNFNGTIYKITNKDIDLVDNGTDGVLFLKSDNTPVDYDPKEINIVEEIFGEIVFSDGEITDNEYKVLFIMWILSIYFMTMNKPICVFYGEKGSGKSFIFKKILLLLFGNLFALKTLPDKKENFTAIITNNKLVVFDNADTARPWLNDSLATAATGGCESMRELYTTNTETTFNIDCFLGLTARTPKFTRDDVADRMLLFPVERLTEFSSEEGIIDRLIKNRHAIMSYIFNHVKIALQNINKPDVKTLSRMGSFENFCRKIRGETECIFKKLICDQQEFSEDMFTEIFHSYCRGQTIETVIKTAQEIAEEMQELCHRRHLKMVITSHAVGYKLKRKYEFVDVEKQILSQRKVQYLLQIKCELKPVEKKTGWMD